MILKEILGSYLGKEPKTGLKNILITIKVLKVDAAPLTHLKLTVESYNMVKSMLCSVTL